MKLDLKDTNTVSIRNPKIDILKGISIFLVVLGHSIQVCFPNHSYNNIYSIIYNIITSSNMVLFMFLAGYTAYHYSLKQQSLQFLIKKFQNLAIPFFSWYFIVAFPIYIYTNGTFNFLNYILRLVTNPGNGLWFLWVLFLNYLILYIMFKLNSKIKLPFIIILIMIFQLIPNVNVKPCA